MCPKNSLTIQALPRNWEHTWQSSRACAVTSMSERVVSHQLLRTYPERRAPRMTSHTSRLKSLFRKATPSNVAREVTHALLRTTARKGIDLRLLDVCVCRDTRASNRTVLATIRTPSYRSQLLAAPAQLLAASRRSHVSAEPRRSLADQRCS